MLKMIVSERLFALYLTVEETAEYLSIPVNYIDQLILHGKIRTVHDGNQYLIYKDQFQDYFQQIEKYKKQIQEYWNEPIPEDIDIKDED